MDVLIVTNISDGKGLLKDGLVLSALIDELGHNAMLVDFRESMDIPADLCIQLEVVVPDFFPCAPKNIWIPNPEWCKPDYLRHIDQFDRVLFKTRDAERLLSPLTDRGVYTGFMAEDHYDPDVPREKVFFHACRGTIAKGTDVILSLHSRVKFPLVIADGLSDEQLKQTQNRCLFHLFPSWYEGFGHSLWEGLSCGAIMVSTDLPPMSEYPGIAYKIPPATFGQQGLARTGLVDSVGVAQAVEWCEGLKETEISLLTQLARNAYLCECESFKQAFRMEVECIALQSISAN